MMAQEHNKAKMEILCKWRVKSVPTGFKRKNGVPPVSFLFDPHISFAFLLVESKIWAKRKAVQFLRFNCLVGTEITLLFC